eukprot:GFUD01035927.1.p1 GENE.GFUD01035927.1~~GFUD01035927.1.p1  ORF type:complete len:204 (+),score=26.65 GFUD01035927.1:186-797(+)
MPAKENILLLTESNNQTKLIRKDVDNLVQNIKENLKLTQYETSVQCPTMLASGSLADFPSTLPDYPSASDPLQSFKARSYIGSRGSRASPYGVVPSKNSKFECECIESGGGNSGVKRTSWAARKRYPSMSANGKKQVELDDPLEMLHELISEGNLLKEAVRRLQLGLSPKIQRNFYDSDDDCRTPPPPLPINNYPDLCEIGIN